MNLDESVIFSQVEIIVTPGNNTAPEFDNTMYSATLQVPKEAGDLVLDLGDSADDEDAPFPGIGEIIFREITEIPAEGKGHLLRHDVNTN